VSDTAWLNRQQAAMIAETAIALGMEHAVLSPGARNTPLVLALHDMQEAGWPIQLHSIIDERAAGFFALGIARRTDKPVLLTCTSGSAGTHYFPAVVEASEGQVPLLIVTADRPEELQDRGAPQTMPQAHMFGPHVRFFAQLNSPEADGQPDHTVDIVSNAMHAALGPAPGPVHLNAAFRKPLWSGGEAPQSPPAIKHLSRTPVMATQTDIERLLNEVNEKSGLIVVGPDPSGRLSPQVVEALSGGLGWPILADPVTRLRYGGGASVIHHYDVLLRSKRACEALKPDLVITLGGTSSSKPLSQVLTQTPCIHISGSGRLQDPWHSVRWTLPADVQSVVEQLKQTPPTPSPEEWIHRWTHANGCAQQAIQRTCSTTIWEGSIAHTMVNSLPKNTLLRLASSMPIRDVDSFSIDAGETLTVSSNRGVNGIDGLIASSLGEATAHDGPVAVLAGDLSFLHDVGALASVPRPHQAVVITVVDNGGGGIFGFLPMAKHPTGFEKWFVTPHNQDISRICSGFGIEAKQVHTLDEYADALHRRLQHPGLHVIHIPIDRIKSTQQHFDAFGQITHAIESML
jgi:2-succinyl-5-enolpyruvyl-6-hydroxy-3-cyclohexene-1-carboxylate synthase